MNGRSYRADSYGWRERNSPLRMLADGNSDTGILAAGQSMGLVRDIPSCRELMDRIMAEAEEIIRQKFTLDI